jgi:sugar phosphate isomerase/epimerase
MPTLPRRTFLRQTFATTGLGILGHPLFAQEKTPAGFGLGFSLYGMKSLPLDEALRVCAEIGYDNVELCLLEGYPSEPKLLGPEDRTRLRESLVSRKLRVSGLMENFSLLADDARHAQQLERIKVAAQLAHDLAPDSPPPLETVLGGKPAEWEMVKDKMAAQLRDWAETAAAAKIVIAIKAHIMSAVQDPERLLWLLRAVSSPAIRLAYDYSHFQLQGLSLAKTLAALIPETGFIHVKDARMSADSKVEFLLPGEGSTNYDTYFKQLHALGYRGDVVVEVSGMLFKQPGYDAQVAAEKSFKALTGGVQKAGLAPGRPGR